VQSASRESQGIYEADLDGVTPPQKLVTSALSGAFVAPRHLLFMVEDQLMAKDFDWKQPRVSGEAIRVAAPVAGASSFNAAFSASQTGLLAFASTPASAELVWMDREGRRIGSVEVPGGHVDFRLSPDGQRLAIAEVDVQTRRPDILVVDLQRGSKTRVTSDAATDASPIWSPDGQRIIFRSNRSGVHDLYDRPSNGTGEERLVFKSPNSKYPTDWMPDGRGIVYHGFGGDTNNDIWYINADGSGTKPLVQGRYDEMQGRVSSDGRWLAYTSLEMGSAEIFLRNLIDGNARWSVSAGGGTDPQWRADGRELFYLSADSWLMAVMITGGRPSSPHKLFHVDVAPAVAPYVSNYDVSRDGRRFLLKIPVNDVTSTPIQVMTNWLISAKR
jgi:Tol biopolymer transport system component